MNKDYFDNIIKFFRENSNIILILILIAAFIIRIKYLNINSAIWWDEAEYLSTAKHWVFKIPYQIAAARQPLLPLFIAFFYKLGISSLGIIKFFTMLIPSLLIVYLTYLLGKELYDKYIAFIASFIMAFFWLILFWSVRFSTDVLGLFFGLASFYFFWKGYVKKEKSRIYLSLMGLFLALGFLVRVGNILVAFIIIAYLLITDNIKIFRNKNLWIAGFIALIVIFPYLLWQYNKYGTPLAFTGTYIGGISSFQESTFFWGFFNFFKIYLLNFYFIFFIIGLLLFYKLIIGFDLIFKQKEKSLLSDLFTVLMILIPLIYFVFILKQPTTEERWAIIMAPAVFYITAKGFILIYNFIKKYNQLISLTLILILLIIGVFYQYKQASTLIDIKKDTYIELKQAGLWMKENSNEDDIILNSGVPQNTFYSERKTLSLFITNESEFKDIVKEYKPKYFVLSALERSADWTYTYPQQHPDLLKPIRAYGPNQEKPILIVYEFIY